MFGLKNLFGKRTDTPAKTASVAEATPPLPQATPSLRSDYVCRELIFDRKQRPAGHLLRLQVTDLGSQAPSTRQRWRDSALINLLTGSEPRWTHGQVWLPLAADSLELPGVDQLDPEWFTLCLTLSPETPPVEPFRTRLEALRQRGFHFGVFRAPQHPCYATLLEFADDALIEVDQTEPDTLRQFSAALRANQAQERIRLMALSVSTSDEHQLCHQWHYDYFHGPFAGQGAPKPLDAHANPHKVQLLHLIRLVQSEAEIPAIAAAFKQDPMLTFRILRHLNSAANGLTREIDSIEHALTLLGRQRLLRWLAILLFSTREPDVGDWLLVENALTRGRLMELLGTDQFGPGQADACFLTGIFSCMDRLLRRPLADALADVHLPNAVATALHRREGPLAALLAVAEAGERFDAERLSVAAKAANLDPEAVNRALLAACSWANSVTEHWE